MKKLSLVMAAVVALLSVAGCAQYIGKGKAPPPVVTKG
jgi:predicted small lipoprotein YifL